MSFLLSKIQARAVQSEATTIRSPAEGGFAPCGRSAVAAEHDESRAHRGADQSQPADAGRGVRRQRSRLRHRGLPALAPTMSDAWLTVVRARPWNWIRNWMGTPKSSGDEQEANSLPVRRTRFVRATGSIPSAGEEKR